MIYTIFLNVHTIFFYVMRRRFVFVRRQWKLASGGHFLDTEVEQRVGTDNQPVTLLLIHSVGRLSYENKLMMIYCCLFQSRQNVDDGTESSFSLARSD
jgi:hypothetical protein